MAKSNRKSTSRKSSKAVADIIEGKESTSKKEESTDTEGTEIVEPMDMNDLPSFEKDEPIVEVVSETKATFEDAPSNTDESEAEIQKKCVQFNRIAVGNKWTSKNQLVDNAKILLGADIEVYAGKDPEIEVFFKYKGVRVPTEGVYHIRRY